MEKHLHIISFDVPFPSDYGGVIPVYSLLKSLYEAGLILHLHCFDYGRGPQPALNEYCGEVKYYERKTGFSGFSFRLPYIVSSRINEDLRQSLLKDDYPILIEGVHCSSLALDPNFEERNIVLRLHNVEFVYYKQLCRASRNLIKRLYYYFESTLLKKYEARLAGRMKVLTLSAEDAIIYRRQLGAEEVFYFPMVVPFTFISSRSGKGTYCLYHGNLSVPENEKAAIWLVRKVFNDLNLPLVVAGKNPGKKLRNIISRNSHVKLIENPTDKEMEEFVADAQVNVLPSFNSTGIKLKLLNALFTGRHCVVNAAMACGTEIVSLCHVADDETEFKSIISKLYQEPFSEKEIEKRKLVLLKTYDNPTNTRSLVQLIY